MQSPETAVPADASGQPIRGRAPLSLVKSPKTSNLSALEREFLPPLLEIQETPPSPTQRKLLWTLVALVSALIIWASFGKISVVSTAPGKFIPDGRVKQLQPLETSIVSAVHVREGQHVQKGELLLELDPSISQAEMQANADKYGFNQLEQARLSAELTHSKTQSAGLEQSKARIALEEQTRRAREQAHAAKLSQAESTVEERSQALAAAQATLEKYRETSAIASERESSARPLVDTGAISRLDYLQLKQTLAESNNDHAAQLKTVEQAKAAVLEARQNVEQVKRDRVADIYNDLNERVTSEPALKGDLDKSKELLALKWMRAPVSGIVQKLEVTTLGQVVTPAQSLITIVPDGTPLIVEATLTNQDIGYVREGQLVEVKVDTFPFQKYGSLRGVLTWVSADAEDKNAASSDTETRTGAVKPQEDNANGERPNAGYVYKVHVRTQDSPFVVDGVKRPLQAGMTVQADIITDRQRVIEFFLSPILKYAEEGLRVR
jgi:hemolysin D